MTCVTMPINDCFVIVYMQHNIQLCFNVWDTIYNLHLAFGDSNFRKCIFTFCINDFEILKNKAKIDITNNTRSTSLFESSLTYKILVIMSQ